MPKSVKSSSITLNAMGRYASSMSYYHHQYIIYICHNISEATNELCRIVVLLVCMSLSFAARINAKISGESSLIKCPNSK